MQGHAGTQLHHQAGELSVRNWEEAWAPLTPRRAAFLFLLVVDVELGS